jgi:hypothetical protein
VVLAKDLFAPELILAAPDLVVIQERDQTAGRLALLERQVVGGAWGLSSDVLRRGRLTSYSFKGGVGRSTAAFVLARTPAERDAASWW